MAERAKFLEFLAFLGRIRGDLANITAPPFFLAPLSVTECGTCWTERPSIFIAPALEPSAQKRALLVLRWILVALKAQFYIGCDGNTEAGIKKPLNGFLGELFFGEWEDESGTVKLTSEQISHHPPMTAVYMNNEDHGIRGEGYTRVEMSFSTSVSIVQTGHAVLHIDKYNEDHLIFLPNAEVKGFLSFRLYPELKGVYHIISSAGYVTELRFFGSGMIWSSSRGRNAFEAKIYHREDPLKKAIYTSRGRWSDKFGFFDAEGHEIGTWDHNAPSSKPADLKLDEASAMDHWETRKAWGPVLSALRQGKMMEVITEKSIVENAQRKMRKDDQAQGKVWAPLLFSSMAASDYKLWDQLANAVGWDLQPAKTNGVWKYDFEKANKAKRPYHGDLTPLGSDVMEKSKQIRALSH